MTCFLLLALLLAPTAVRAAESPVDLLQPSGRVFSDAYFPTRDPMQAPFNELSTSLWIQIDPRLGDRVSGRAIFEGRDVSTSTTQTPQFRSTLREGYIEYSQPAWFFRMGKVIQPWGKSDAINPTDYFSSKDYSRFNPDEEVRRTGNTELDFTWTPGHASDGSPWTLELRWAPVSAQSQLLLPPATLPAGVTIQASPVAPAASVANSDLGARLSYAGQGWDASLSGFRGLTKSPEFEIVSITGAPPALSVTAAKAFQRLRIVGGDFSWTPEALAKWIFRGEAAYSWTDNGDGLNPALEPSHLDSVLGAERPLGGDFRAQLQFLWRWHPNLRGPETASGLVQQQLARANAQILGYQFRSRAGATLRVSYTDDSDGFDAEVFLIGNFVGGDYLVRPKISYTLTDSLRLTVGSDYYGGPTDRTLGALHAYNSLFAEAKLSF